jgi:hypothetical protein
MCSADTDCARYNHQVQEDYQFEDKKIRTQYHQDNAKWKAAQKCSSPTYNMCSRTYKNGYKPIKPRKAYKIGA